MTEQTYFLIVAVVVFGLIPLVPRMIGLRTRVLYALRLRSLAGWHERNAGTLVVAVRAIFAATAVVLAVLAFAGR